MTPLFSRPLLRALVCAGAAFGYGCPLFYDIDGVPLESPDLVDMRESETADMAESTDGEMIDPVDTDVPEDMNAPPDMDVPDTNQNNGQTCVDDPGTIGGNCDPVAQDCEDNSDFCDIRIVNSEFAAICTAIGAANYVLDKDDPCEPNATVDKCKIGLICRVASCASLCRLADGSGCESDEVCTPIAAQIPEYGVCDSRCD